LTSWPCSRGCCTSSRPVPPVDPKTSGFILGELTKNSYQIRQDLRLPAKRAKGRIAGLCNPLRNTAGGRKDEQAGNFFDRNRLTPRTILAPGQLNQFCIGRPHLSFIPFSHLPSALRSRARSSSSPPQVRLRRRTSASSIGQSHHRLSHSNSPKAARRISRCRDDDGCQRAPLATKRLLASTSVSPRVADLPTARSTSSSVSAAFWRMNVARSNQPLRIEPEHLVDEPNDYSGCPITNLHHGLGHAHALAGEALLVLGIVDPLPSGVRCGCTSPCSS
jgi:hypothetical protein